VDTELCGWARDHPSLGNRQEGICSTAQTQLLLLLELRGLMTDNGLGRQTKKPGSHSDCFPVTFMALQIKQRREGMQCVRCFLAKTKVALNSPPRLKTGIKPRT